MLTSKSIRKKLSYIMLPVMVVYTIMPNMSYGSEIYTKTGSSAYKSETDNTTASDIARKAAEELNKETLKKAEKVSKSNDDKSSPSSSAASNYTMGIGAEVNAQTGQLDITFNDVKLAGMSEDTAIDLGISNGETTGEIYGVPAGWKFSMDYIDTQSGKLYMNGSQNYTIDSSFSSADGYKSGLRYCTSKAILFWMRGTPHPEGWTPPSPSYCNNYQYILSTNKGSNEYFDYYGKLICQDDRFGNHIIYNYDKETGTPYEAKLTSITDSFGQNIEIKNYRYVITITMPDKKTVIYDFSSGDKITVKGVSGRQASLYLNGDKRVRKIEYPTGGYVEYFYANNAVPYQVNGGAISYFNGIKEVRQNPGSSKGVLTEYDYEAKPGHSFAGAGLCDYESDKDALMQSNPSIGNGYSYGTKITSHRSEDCGGNIESVQEFNFLHLPTSSTVSSKGSTLTKTETQYLGQGEKSGDFPGYNQLQSNYNLPAKVTSTTGGKVHLVETAYDDYSRPVSVMKYNNGQEKATSITTTTYYPGLYDNIHSQSVVDNIDHTTTTVKNKLSSDGKYINSSTASIDKSNASGKTTATEADEYGRITSSTISTSGGTLKNSSETSTTTTAYSYDKDTHILTVTNTDNLKNSASKTIDVRNGNIISETDARGNSVNYTYDPTGLIVTKTYPDGSTETIKSSDPKKVEASSSNGMVKTSILDGFGRVIEESDNFGGKNTVQYNDLGKPSVKTDVFGHSIKYKYDYQGRETSETDYLKNVNKIVYDDGAQTATESINGIEASISYYDDNGNVKSQTSFLSSKNSVSNATYNGKNLETNSSLSLEGIGVIASSASDYDIDGKLLTATVKTNDGTDGTSVYTLSLFGNVENRTTTFNNVSPGVDLKYKGQAITSETKEYNSIGQLTKLTNQAKEPQSIGYKYDANGNLASVTDFAGNTFNYTYDSMNRMTEMSGPEYTVKNDYYGVEHKGRDGKLKTRNLSKKDEKLIDSISYDYDDHGRLSSVAYMDGKSISMIYDKFDRVTSMTDFADIETTYKYDNTENGVPDNITSVSNKFGSALYSYYTYDPNKPIDSNNNPLFGDRKTLKEVSYGNEVTITYKYETSANKAPKLTSLETYGKNGLMNGSYYTYDTQDRVDTLTQKSATSPEDSNCNNERDFTYNDMSQLIGEVVKDVKGQIVTSTSYTFDLNGNITKKIIKDGKDNLRISNIYTYNEIDQLLSWKEEISGKVNTYRYDLNGNMISITEGNGIIKQFTYNSLNQLIEYKDQGVDVCYEYNAESLRACKYFAGNSSNRIKYYYSQNGEIMNEEDNTGVKTSYLIAGGRILRAIVSSTNHKPQTTNQIEWYIKNGKDVVATIDKDQKNTNIYNYNAYGEDTDLNQGGSVRPKKDTFDINDNPYKYSGYYLDEESGMYYLQARYYSPELMRFISRDTYDLSNRYAYGDGDPISNVDPNGHMPQAMNWALAGAAILGSIIAIICSFGAAAPLAIGLSIAGGTLGLASGGTQVASMLTTGQTSEALGWVSFGLGIAGGLLSFYTGGEVAEFKSIQQTLTKSLPKDFEALHEERVSSFSGLMADLEKQRGLMQEDIIATMGDSKSIEFKVRQGDLLADVTPARLGLDARPLDLQTLGMGEKQLSYIRRFGDSKLIDKYRDLTPEYLWSASEKPYVMNDVKPKWDAQATQASKELTTVRSGILKAIKTSNNMTEFVSRYQEIIRPLL